MLNSYLAVFINIFGSILSFLILLRVLSSWVKVGYHPVIEFLKNVTDPVLNVFKKFIPPIGMIDISPMVAVLAIQLAQDVLLKLLGGG